MVFGEYTRMVRIGFTVWLVQVPLGVQHNDRIPPDKRFTPRHVVEQLAMQGIEVCCTQEIVQKTVAKGKPVRVGNAMQVGLVIDLTNTWRYYDVEEWTAQGVEHCKVSTNTVRLALLPQCNVHQLLRCMKVALRGRGSVPSPEAVNEIFWTGFTFILREPHKKIAIHCTHGYNRTGVQC